MSLDEEVVRSTACDPEVQWRRLDRRLWVGRAGQRHMGTIELGSRYVYVDVDGIAHQGRQTLHEAQDEATGPIAVVRSSAGAGGTPSRRLIVQLGLLIVLALVVGGLIWTVGSMLFVR